jgi:hypothetical protein
MSRLCPPNHATSNDTAGQEEKDDNFQLDQLTSIAFTTNSSSSSCASSKVRVCKAIILELDSNVLVSCIMFTSTTKFHKRLTAKNTYCGRDEPLRPCALVGDGVSRETFRNKLLLPFELRKINECQFQKVRARTDA